jgi:xanthine/uracil permease
MKASMFKSVNEIYKSIKPFLNSILGRGILIGAITAILGLLMVVGYVLLKKYENRDKSVIKTAE